MIIIASMFMLVACGGNNSAKNNEKINEEITEDVNVNKGVNEEIVTYSLVETIWSANKEKITEDGTKIAYHAGIMFTSDTEFMMSEGAFLVDEDSELSTLTYEGTYECKGLLITLTMPNFWEEGKDKTWILNYDDDKIKFTSDNYGEFTLEKNHE